MHIGELRSLSLFDGLTGEQLAELVAGSAEVRIPARPAKRSPR